MSARRMAGMIQPWTANPAEVVASPSAAMSTKTTWDSENRTEGRARTRAAAAIPGHPGAIRAVPRAIRAAPAHVAAYQRIADCRHSHGIRGRR
jgi:hypothetical protein